MVYFSALSYYFEIYMATGTHSGADRAKEQGQVRPSTTALFGNVRWAVGTWAWICFRVCGHYILPVQVQKQEPNMKMRLSGRYAACG